MTWHSAHLSNDGTVAKVGHPAGDEDVLCITEVWESQASHQASLEAPAAKEIFRGADTLIAGYEKVGETRPVVDASGPLHGFVRTRA